MRALITADLHLTSNPDDAYRWRIFGLLRKAAKREQATHIFILGDLTNEKDRHNALLVNRMFSGFRRLARLCPVVVLFGNHDYIDHTCPFFQVLSSIENVECINRPTMQAIGSQVVAWLPHTRTPVKDWQDYKCEIELCDLVLLHQPLLGAQTTGTALQEGLDPAYFKHCKGSVVAGDIHAPQQVGKVLYCGSPYPIGFGEDHKHRFLLYDGRRVHEIEVPRIMRKVTITLSGNTTREDVRKALAAGDQVRVVVKRGGDLGWLKDLPVYIKSVSHDAKAIVRHRPASLRPMQAFKAFCARHKVDTVSQREGKFILKSVLSDDSNAAL